MAIYKPYPKYKNSNIPWLGEIPEHWEIEKVKRQFEVSRGRVIANTDLIDNGNYPVYSSQTKHKGLLGKIDTYDYDGEYISWTTDGVYAGTTFVRKGKFNATNICGLLKPKNNVNIDYFGYLFSHIIPPNKRPDTNGAKIMSNEMKNISFIIPPFEEQTAIARFLDYKMAKINRFIRKKKQLIKLLNEQKAAIINQAVTKGLDPNVKMKDSGIEWLGEIPEHWELRKLKGILAKGKDSLKPGPFGSDLKNQDIIPVGYKVYTQRAVLDDDFSTSSYCISEEKYNELSAFEVKSGDILLTTRGTIGRCCIVPHLFEKGVIHPCIIRLRINQGLVLHQFVKLFIEKANAFQVALKYNSNATTIDVIYGNVLRDVFFIIPPIEEQEQIISFIEKETTTINTTISKIEKELALTEEYKTALIAEAVTGKIDVRGYEVPEISEEETYEEIEEEISMAAEDAEAYQTVEE